MRKQKLYRDADLTDEMSDMTFENFDLEWCGNSSEDSKKLHDAWAAAKTYVAESNTIPWLCLQGTMGSGKTHLSAAIAHVLLERGETVLFRVVPKMLKWFQASFNIKEKSDQDDYQTKFDEVCNVPVLILDDFGAHNDTKWAQGELFTLLNHRYSRNLRTVISTNLQITDIEDRVQDRILDKRRCMFVTMGSQSYRLRGWGGSKS